MSLSASTVVPSFRTPRNRSVTGKAWAWTGFQ